jgi:hypothetical protein
MKKKLNERGIPSVGGVSPGDSSNNLGQARRPWHLTGASGGHTQSADSNFSSRLSRVNKGRDDDKYAYRDMFPENEEEESERSTKPKRRRRRKTGHKEDSYDMKIRSKLSPDLRGRKPMPERKLTTDIDQLIEENEHFQIMLEDDRMGFSTAHELGNLFTGVTLDILAQIPGTFIPGFDIARVIANLSQLNTSIDKGKELISRYHNVNAVDLLDGEYYDKLDKVIDKIVTDISDVIESAVSIIPVIGDISGYGVTVASWSKKIAGIASSITGSSAAGMGTIKAAVIREIAASIVPKDLTNLDSGFENETSISTAVPEAIRMAGTLSDIMTNFDMAYDAAYGNYEDLNTDERIIVWKTLFDNQALKHVPTTFNNTSSTEYSVSESKIRSLITQILTESEDHDCEKEHPGKTCDKWKADQPDLEEHSIGGYVGPMASPVNPKKFYEKMIDVSYPGSHYVNDPPKSKA